CRFHQRLCRCAVSGHRPVFGLLGLMRNTKTQKHKGTNPLAASGGFSPSSRGRMRQTYTILPLEKGETPPKAARGFVPSCLCVFVLSFTHQNTIFAAN